MKKIVRNVVLLIIFVFMLYTERVLAESKSTIYQGYYTDVYNSSTDKLYGDNWKLVFYLDKDDNVLLANSIDENFYYYDYNRFVKLAEDVSIYNDQYTCYDDDYNEYKCSFDSYHPNDKYEDIEEWRYMGVVNSCSDLKLSGDALDFCNKYIKKDSSYEWENTYIEVFKEKGKTETTFNLDRELKADEKGTLTIHFESDYNIHRIKYQTSSNIKIEKIKLEDGWEYEEKDGVYYFKNSNDSKTITDIIMDIQTSKDLKDGDKISTQFSYIVTYNAFLSDYIWSDEDIVTRDCTKPFDNFGTYYGFGEYFNSNYCLSCYSSEETKLLRYYLEETPDSPKPEIVKNENPNTKVSNRIIIAFTVVVCLLYLLFYVIKGRKYAHK